MRLFLHHVTVPNDNTISKQVQYSVYIFRQAFPWQPPIHHILPFSGTLSHDIPNGHTNGQPPVLPKSTTKVQITRITNLVEDLKLLIETAEHRSHLLHLLPKDTTGFVQELAKDLYEDQNMVRKLFYFSLLLKGYLVNGLEHFFSFVFLYANNVSSIVCIEDENIDS
jgi:hypothetical protein